MGESLTIGSLFSGIGGLELGLERAGLGPVIWQAESNHFCRRVLSKRWPDVTRFQDVRSIKAGRVPTPDVICGGFPCQDISTAGKRAGLGGTKSGLWGEFARIVRELTPRFVVIENSPALRIRGLDVVLGDLAACGYDAVWDCLPASAVGAPHRRDRIYVVAWRVSDSDGFELRNEPERGEGRAQETDGGNPFAAHMGAGSVVESDFPLGSDMHSRGELLPGPCPVVCREADGLPDWVDQHRALGNAVVG